MTFDELQDIAKLRGASGTDTERVGPMLDVIGGALLWWNLEDEDGQEIPISEYRKQDAAMLIAIVSEWTSVVGDIPAPLDSASPSGKPLEEAQIPMEIPSSSHPNSNTPS